MSLAGRFVLVAGEHDLAPSIARALVEARARVILPARRDKRFRDGDSVETLNLPLGTVEEAEALAARCWTSFGRLDGLVLVMEQADPDTSGDSDDDWQAAIRTALKIPFFLARAVATRMAEAGGGCIVHVVGAASRTVSDVDYVTNSAGLTMIQALAKALPARIRMCAVVKSAANLDTEATGLGRVVKLLLEDDSLAIGTVVRIGGS